MESGLFHCHVDNVSRRRPDGRERSAVATAAYVSGTDLWNEREQKVTSFGGRADVTYSELFAPPGAPDWALDREKLWNAVDLSARRRDARLAKTIVVAFSRDIPKDAWRGILREFVAPYVAGGMVADAAIHDDGTGQNPHMHVLLTVNHLKPDGFGGKIDGVDHKSFVTQARTGWEAVSNKYLAAAGASVRLDRRSYKAQGIAKKPTVHRGPNPVDRRAQRARAARLRQEINVSDRASFEERRAFPLLTQRQDWPPVAGMPQDLTADERQEYDQFAVRQRLAAEREAAHSLETRRIPEWFDAKQSEAERRPLTRAEQDVRRAPESQDPLLQPIWWDEEPSPRDFGRSSLEMELAEERQRYEADVSRRAVNMPRTPQETELLRLAEQHSPEMRKRVEDELFERRVRRVRDADDERRLGALEARMGPELRQHFAEHLQSDPDMDRYPVPGPYWEADQPSRLERAQDEMLRDYDREDER
jgi:hypothetical protein